MLTHFLVLLLPGVLCLFEMRPDVRFDERNDRFDVSPLFDAGDYADKEDFRRSGDASQDPNLIQLMRQIKRRSGNRRGGFAWHDDMESAEEEQNFERNLEQFRSHNFRKSLVDYLHGGQPDEMPPTRRSGADSDKEILMHHALPISIKVKGYLQAPGVL